MAPALLSALSLGSAAAARVAASTLVLPLLLLSVSLLGVAHHRVWVRRRGHRAARWVLMVNTLLVIVLWAVRLWS